MARKGREAQDSKKGAATKAPVAGGPAIPKWLPPVLYGVVTLFLFRKFVFTGEMLFGTDTVSLGYMARAFFAEALKGGTFPLWNPVILGGTPFLDSLAGGDSLYPTSILLLIMAPFRALGWKLVIHVFLAGLFTYGWIRALGRSQPAALLSGLAFLMAPFMVTLVYPGHDGKLFVTALTPLLFWAVEKALAKGRLLAFSGMAAVIGLVILTTHFQQAYFLFGAVGIYAVSRTALLWKDGLAPTTAGLRFGLFLAFSVLGAGVAGVQLLPAVDYVLESSRRTATTTQASDEGSVAYSSSWSMHPEEVAAMVVPEFVGSSVGGAAWTSGTYWGRNFFKLNHEYAGLVVLLLAGLAFFGAPARGIRLTFLGIGGVALLYTLGLHTPVWRIFYEVVPGISLFRAPSIAAFLFGFGAVTLMAFGVDRALGIEAAAGSSSAVGAGAGSSRKDGESADKSLLLFLSIAAGLLFLGTLMASGGALTSLWTSVLYRGIEPGKMEALARAQTFIARGFLISTVLAGVLLALTWWVRKGKIPSLVWVIGVGLLLILDLGRVDDPFIQTQDFHQWSAPDPNVQYLLDRQVEEEPFRVLAMGGRSGFGQDVTPGMHGLELANGHHPNDLARYRELIGMVGSGAPENFIDYDAGSLRYSLLSILNVRYIIWPVAEMGGLPGMEAVMASSLDGRTVYEAVYEVPTLPRARLVGEARVLAEDETVPYLLSPLFRPGEEVVLTEPAPIELPGGAVSGEVSWREKGLNRLSLAVESDENALLVLAENWYPAWKAEVDGQETPVLRANHALRAIPVSAGTHEVEIYFDGGSLRGGLFTSLASILLLGGAGILGYFRRRAS
jgi:hypothetical protein